MNDETKTAAGGTAAPDPGAKSAARDSSSEKPSSPPNWKARFRWGVIVVVVVVVGLVILQNRATTEVKIPLVGAISMPLWLLLTLHFLLGGLAGMAFSAWRRKKKSPPLTGR